MLCVPFDDAAAILQATRAKHAAETVSLDEIRTHGPRPKPWVDETLTRLGCPIER